MLLTTTTLLSEGGALAVVVQDFSETPHWTRVGRDSPRPQRQSVAELHPARPLFDQRAGAPHGRGDGEFWRAPSPPRQF